MWQDPLHFCPYARMFEAISYCAVTSLSDGTTTKKVKDMQMIGKAAMTVDYGRTPHGAVLKPWMESAKPIKKRIT